MSQTVRRATPRRRLPPPVGFQSRFLQGVRGIVEGKTHNTTHDFAILHALADHAREVEIETGDELRIPLHRLSERIIELYWPQAAPWRGEGVEGPSDEGTFSDPELVLVQNTGRKGGSRRRAAVLRRVLEARREYGPDLEALRTRDAEWTRLVSSVYRTLRQGPLRRLQEGADPAGERFFQPRIHGRGAGAGLTLEPGIGFCLRAFLPKVVGETRSAWARSIRETNPALQEEPGELQRFLFGEPVVEGGGASGPDKSPEESASRGLGQLVHRHADRLMDILTHASRGGIQAPVQWVVPEEGAVSGALSGEAALDRLGVHLHERPLASFWPNGGPRWDAVGRDAAGAAVFLHVRASILDLVSAPAEHGRTERVWAADSVEQMRERLGAEGPLDWAATFFGLTSRLAHLHLLRELNGVEAWIVCVHLTSEPGGEPGDEPGAHLAESEWFPHLRTMYRGLGLPPLIRPDRLLDVFLEAG